MGTGSSINLDTSDDHAGGQLYVSLKMESYSPKEDLVPHVFGSAPLVGSWDPSKAVSLSISYTT